MSPYPLQIVRLIRTYVFTTAFVRVHLDVTLPEPSYVKSVWSESLKYSILKFSSVVIQLFLYMFRSPIKFVCCSAHLFHVQLHWEWISYFLTAYSVELNLSFHRLCWVISSNQKHEIDAIVLNGVVQYHSLPLSFICSTGFFQHS